MRTYTVILSKVVNLENGTKKKAEYYTVITEAETAELARYYVGAKAPYGRWSFRAEQGDTRSNHPGCQDLIFENRQVDLSEVVS